MIKYKLFLLPERKKMAWPAGPAVLFDASAALSAVLRVRSTLATLAWHHGISVAEQFSSLMFVFAEECRVILL